MGSSAVEDKTGDEIYVLVNYEDAYVQPLILAALHKHFPQNALHPITSLDALPSRTSRVLQWVQYEAIDFPFHLSHAETSLANAYVIRKALIRKHYLSTTVANWVAKRPDSVLGKHVKPAVEFEVDYAEFLDDALVEAWELHESWRRGEEGEKEWWILKPGMSERGQGIRLFSSEEELQEIFEGWDPESDDEEEEEDDEQDARSDAGSASGHAVPTGKKASDADVDDGDNEAEGNGIITSQLRHFIAQPYIHPPLLLHPPGAASPSSPDALRKFHIRTYVLATGALQIHVYRPMLALFAARPYTAPSAEAFTSDADDALRAHLTNTCLQSTGEREGSVGLFWDLPDDIPAQPDTAPAITSPTAWKDKVFAQICAATGEIFEAAARGMSIHFQALPNSFELFGLDFMVGIEADGELRTWLLEVNAFPDFRQTGEDCKGVVEGLMEGVVGVAIKPFFGGNERSEGAGEAEGMVRVLDVDLGRR